MHELDIDGLSAIVEAAAPGGLFDRMDSALRQSGKYELADALVKFQQDAGEGMNRIFFPEDYTPGAFAPGPEAARLRDAYEPVTMDRLSLLTRIADAVTDRGLEQETYNLLAKVQPPAAFSSFSSPKGPTAT